MIIPPSPSHTLPAISVNPDSEMPRRFSGQLRRESCFVSCETGQKFSHQHVSSKPHLQALGGSRSFLQQCSKQLHLLNFNHGTDNSFKTRKKKPTFEVFNVASYINSLLSHGSSRLLSEQLDPPPCIAVKLPDISQANFLWN